MIGEWHKYASSGYIVGVKTAHRSSVSVSKKNPSVFSKKVFK